MGKKKCCVRRWTSQMKEERKFTEEEGAVKVKEGNSFPFSFVQLPRGSPFISFPLTCFSLPQIRDFLVVFLPLCSVPVIWYLFGIQRNTRQLSFYRQSGCVTVSVLLMLPAGVSFYFPNCPFCSFLALFPFCCHLLLTCDPTTDTDLQNLVRLHPEPDPSFPLCFSFFLLHSCCGYEVRDRLSSVEQTSPGVMTHLSDTTDTKSFQTPLA